MAMEKPPRKGESQSIVIDPSKGKVLWRSALHLLFTLAGIGIILGSLAGIPTITILSITAGIPTLVFLGLGPLLFFYPIVLQVFASSSILVINDEVIQSTLSYWSAMVKWGAIGRIDLRND